MYYIPLLQKTRREICNGGYNCPGKDLALQWIEDCIILWHQQVHKECTHFTQGLRKIGMTESLSHKHPYLEITNTWLWGKENNIEYGY